MALLGIRLYGDQVLRRRGEPIAEITDEVRQLAEDMIDTMYEAEGVGLAAPQIGRSVRLFVADGEYEEGMRKAQVFINPEVLEADGTWKFEEGCLSIPGIRADVVRPERVRVRYMDLEGKVYEEEMHELWARVFQHELDHLDGKLFIDYLSPIKRSLLAKRLKDLEREEKLDREARESADA